MNPFDQPTTSFPHSSNNLVAFILLYQLAVQEWMNGWNIFFESNYGELWTIQSIILDLF